MVYTAVQIRTKGSIMKFTATLSIVAALLFSPSAYAQVKMQGQFAAGKDCPALVSIKKKTNPDNASVSAGKTYELLGRNKDQASHYWINIPTAKPSQRWVALECGSIDGKQAGATPETGAAVDTPDGTVKPKPQPKGSRDGVPFYVLALSWQPAFCEGMRGKVECKLQNAQSYEATHFALHGLWPQPRRNVFCGVDRGVAALDDQHQWEKLPVPQLTTATRTALNKVMPGTQSLLDSHEWIKHGTCYPGGNAETYFADSIRLTEAINGSAAQKLMADNIGKTINTKDLRGAFDQTFGAGAGERVRVSCDKAGRIAEITIGLKGDISAGTAVAALIAASEPTDAGCPSGLVDPAGYSN